MKCGGIKDRKDRGEDEVERDECKTNEGEKGRVEKEIKTPGNLQAMKSE